MIRTAPLVFLCVLATPAAAQDVSSALEGVQIEPDRVRLLFSRPVNFRSSVLEDPPRLSFGLDQPDPTLQLRRFKGNGPLVKEVRVSREDSAFGPTTRIVVELRHPAKYDANWEGRTFTVGITPEPGFVPKAEPRPAAPPKPAPVAASPKTAPAKAAETPKTPAAGKAAEAAKPAPAKTAEAPRPAAPKAAEAPKPAAPKVAAAPAPAPAKAAEAPKPAAPAAATAESPAKPARARGWMVQIASFTEEDKARRCIEELKPSASALSIQTASVDGERVFRVRAGPFPGEAPARELAAKIESRDYHPLVFPAR